MAKKIPVNNIPECIWQTIVHDKDMKFEEFIQNNYTNASVADLIKESRNNAPDNNGNMEIVMEESGIIDVD